MDEILIEDKKYVSSKRAAKLTGYAKDYIGQLCREGRVQARLVGRSWYVLEAAIADHRFGKEKDTIAEIKVAPPGKPAVSSTWKAPRYEASVAEGLPLDTETPIHTDTDEGNQVKEPGISERLQDSWREWFEHVADSRPITATTTQEEFIKVEEEEEPERPYEEEGIPIPVHTIRHSSSSAELVPRVLKDYSSLASEEDYTQPRYQEEKKAGKRVGIVVLHLLGVPIALVMATIAALNTGYFDEYILSYKQVSIVAGVILYNK